MQRLKLNLRCSLADCGPTAQCSGGWFWCSPLAPAVGTGEATAGCGQMPPPYSAPQTCHEAGVRRGSGRRRPWLSWNQAPWHGMRRAMQPSRPARTAIRIRPRAFPARLVLPAKAAMACRTVVKLIARQTRCTLKSGLTAAPGTFAKAEMLPAAAAEPPPPPAACRRWSLCILLLEMVQDSGSLQRRRVALMAHRCQPEARARSQFMCGTVLVM